MNRRNLEYNTRTQNFESGYNAATQEFQRQDKALFPPHYDSYFAMLKSQFALLQVLSLVTFSVSIQTDVALADELLKKGDRIIFLGDSNTYAGTYVADFDALTRSAGHPFDVINVGLPSETCCGLSEPDHPFPRPTVQERIDRVLKKTKPDVVVACYGMNDGIYHPFSEDRFATYKSGIDELISKVKKSGAKLVLLTPPPFDPLPMKKKKKLVGKDSKKFAWFLIYEDYDSVMKQYSKWILTQAPKVDVVVDIRSPIVEFIDKKRQSNPDFTMSGDGVHFNATCHRQITTELARVLLPKIKVKINPEIAKLAGRKMQILRDAWLTETGHKRPGVKKGLPIKKALALAKEIDAQIDEVAANVN